MNYDIFGDIHGHANDLKNLLHKMGYSLSVNGYYHHPKRQAIFVGDYIDRGIHSKEVVQIVRAMQENGSAIALMGNHEYNAICFHTMGNDNNYLRPRNIKNIKQHCATLQSFDTEGELKEALEWFKKLPLFYENNYLRVTHACWDNEQIAVLVNANGGNTMKMENLQESATERTPLYDAIEVVLKGQEVDLPQGIIFKDKDKNERSAIRVKWWENPAGKTYKEICVKMEKAYEHILDLIPPEKTSFSVYGNNEKPVFFGHYWLDADQPTIQKPNVCCLDYSVAKKGKLVAYRFDGEDRLSNKKFVYV